MKVHVIECRAHDNLCIIPLFSCLCRPRQHPGTLVTMRICSGPDEDIQLYVVHSPGPLMSCTVGHYLFCWLDPPLLGRQHSLLFWLEGNLSPPPGPLPPSAANCTQPNSTSPCLLRSAFLPINVQLLPQNTSSVVLEPHVTQKSAFGAHV